MNNEMRRMTERVTGLRLSLTKIRANEGKVCWNFELCEHGACRSSYASWQIADTALQADEKVVTQ